MPPSPGVAPGRKSWQLFRKCRQLFAPKRPAGGGNHQTLSNVIDLRRPGRIREATRERPGRPHGALGAPHVAWHIFPDRCKSLTFKGRREIFACHPPQGSPRGEKVGNYSSRGRHRRRRCRAPNRQRRQTLSNVIGLRHPGRIREATGECPFAKSPTIFLKRS